jgi:cytochrome c peroxidase
VRCHSGPHLTNLKHYDLGMGRFQDTGRNFDTPTLVEIWRTAPYLHDGRAATLRDMLTTHNPKDRHGKTSGLSDEQIDDLVEFLLVQ